MQNLYEFSKVLQFQKKIVTEATLWGNTASRIYPWFLFVPFWLRKTGFFYTSDGIFLQEGSFGSKGRPWSFFLLLKAHTVPMVSQTRTFSLPILKKCHSWNRLPNHYTLALHNRTKRDILRRMSAMKPK